MAVVEVLHCRHEPRMPITKAIGKSIGDHYGNSSTAQTDSKTTQTRLSFCQNVFVYRLVFASV